MITHMIQYQEIVFLHPRNKPKKTPREKHRFLLIKEDIQEAESCEYR